MKTIHLFALLAGFILILPGCKKTSESEGENCNGVESANTDAVSGPSAGAVNTDNLFAVTVGLMNGCKSFNSFEEVKNGFTINVTAKVNSIGCICTQNYSQVTGGYNFRASAPGTYSINFFLLGGAMTTKTIVIN